MPFPVAWPVYYGTTLFEDGVILSTYIGTYRVTNTCDPIRTVTYRYVLLPRLRGYVVSTPVL